MPLIPVRMITFTGDVPKTIAEVRYEPGSTLSQFQSQLDRTEIVPGPYHFWSLLASRPISQALANVNLVSDYTEIIVMLGSPSSVGSGSQCSDQDVMKESHDLSVRKVVPASLHVHNEQNPDALGENEVDVLCEDLSFNVPNKLPSGVHMSPTQSPILNSSANLSPQESHVVSKASWWPSGIPTDMQFHVTKLSDYAYEQHGSKVMSDDLVRVWRVTIRKLLTFMSHAEVTDQCWTAVTWDESTQAGQIPQAAIICMECRDHYSVTPPGAPITRGKISTFFTNFTTKHIKAKKHMDSVKRKRVSSTESVNSTERPAKRAKDDRMAVETGIEIVQAVNADIVATAKYDVHGDTFLVRGDLEAEPCDAAKFRVFCSVCAIFFTLCPRLNTLRHNLTQHAGCGDHTTKAKGSSKALSTGERGRPSKVDGRDRKQQDLNVYFGKLRSKTPGTSSDAGIMLDTDPALSLLCWGFRWKFFRGKDISGLMFDRNEGVEWRCEPYTDGVIGNLETGSYVSFEGTFRHIQCSRVSVRGGGFENLICESCYTIPLQGDFRKRMEREANAERKRGTRTPASGIRLDLLQPTELEQHGRNLSDCVVHLRNMVKMMRGSISRLRAKGPSLKVILADAAEKKDVLKFCQTFVNAHRGGAFGGKTALLGLLQDLVKNVTRGGKGHRWSKETKSLMQALYQHGGRRVIECLSVNIGTPAVGTLRRDSRGMVDFQTGLNPSQFKFIAAVYKDAKEQAGIIGDIPVILAEDETAMKRSVRWLQKYDILVGFCGSSENHICNPGLEIKVGDGETGLHNIEQAFDTLVVGHICRVVMVNPLVHGLPRLCLLASNTCNSFDAQFVRQQWNAILEMWNTYCRSSVGPIIGHASDGDARRRKLMLEDYVGKSVTLPRNRVSIGWEGWGLSYSFVYSDQSHLRDPYGLHDQDYIHNAKKLVNPLDVPSKVLKPGNSMAVIEHIDMACKLYPNDHGLTAEDITRADRQNWASAQKLCSQKVIGCLKQYRSQRERSKLCLGTEMYLTICADYIDIFLDLRLNLLQRIVKCAKVSFFFRLWRLWIKVGGTGVGGNTQKLTLQNMISSQSYYDIQMSCHFVVHLILLFKDSYSALPVPLHLTGSDSCEQFFSKVGGMKGHERNYDFADLLAAASQLNRLGELGMSKELISAGLSKKKFQNVWMDLHPLLLGEVAADMGDYTVVATNAMVIDALKCGFSEAQSMCTRLQMCPSPSTDQTTWWETPWITEKILGFEDCLAQEINVDDTDEPVVRVVPQSVVPIMVQPSSEVNVDGDWDDHVDDEVVIRGEVDHEMQELLDEVLQGQGTGPDGTLDQTKEHISPFVSFKGRVMWKGTVVATYNGHPHTSKDRLTRVRHNFYFNSLTEKRINCPGEESMPVTYGVDCGIVFVEASSTPTVTRPSRGKRKSKKSNVHVSSNTSHTTDRMVWYIGRVQRVRRKFGVNWGRVRHSVDLMDRPGLEVGQSGSACEVLFHYYRENQSIPGEYTYEITDTQWIDLDCVITVITMNTDPDNPDKYYLEPAHKRILDDHINSSEILHEVTC